MIPLKLGKRGEIVIPKKIRDHLGLLEDGQVMLQVDGKTITLRPSIDNIADIWAQRARCSNVDITKWKMGDELYEAEFR